jgi:hypothetical protein
LRFSLNGIVEQHQRESFNERRKMLRLYRTVRPGIFLMFNGASELCPQLRQKEEAKKEEAKTK